MKIAGSKALLLVLLISTAVHAQGPEDLESTDTSSAGTASTQAPKKKVVRRAKYQEYTVGFSTWQEDVKATRGSESAPMLTQSLGLNVGWIWNKFFTSGNWRQWHTLDFTIGQIKGKGAISAIPDELKKQSFYMFRVQPGLMWRNSPVSELGLGVPINFRFIKWDVIASSGLTMDKKSSFSAGICLGYVLRLSARNSVHVTLERQYMWNTTMWTVGFNHVL